MSSKSTIVSSHQEAFQSIPLPENAKKNLKKWKTLLSSELKSEKERSNNRHPLETRKGLILTYAYGLTKKLLDEDRLVKLIPHVEKLAFSEKIIRSSIDRNPFLTGLRFLCNKGVRKEEDVKLHKWARLLHYAYLHNVETNQLLGFLYQEGSYEVINERYNKIASKR